MRQKLALTIALASFFATTALGVGMAGASPFAGSEGPLSTSSPLSTTPLSTTPLSTMPAAPTCSGEIKQNSEKPVQPGEPKCPSPSGNSEASGPPPNPPGTAAAPSNEITSGGGVHVGTTINGNTTKTHKGVTHNQTIGGRDKGASTNGGVSFPSATGGQQPPPEAANGGSSFTSGGAPTPANPTTTIASFGPAPIGVPNFVINSFQIPPFLLPIYQACGTQYGVPWEVLAAINKIETDFGANLNVSSAGAVGWMQFLPSTWATYGVDANGDGHKDPYNPVDAICAAANYLHAAGASHDLYKAILAYNHAEWYAQEVLTYARVYGRLPENLVGSLAGLTEGDHFPVAADARYADEVAAREVLQRASAQARRSYGSAAETISSSPTRRGINIFSHQGAPIVAVNDGVIRAVGHSRRLGKFIVLEDAYGNRYTYAELGQIVRAHGGVLSASGSGVPLVNTQNLRPRLFALPNRQRSLRRAELGPQRHLSRPPLALGAHVLGGTVIARMGGALGGVDPHVNFSIRPAGIGGPQIDPKPILDGWKLLEATAIYRSNGKSPFSRSLGVSGVLLLSKGALQQRVLADHNLSTPPCARREISTGQIDRRALALLEYLVAEGYRLKTSSLQCPRASMASVGNGFAHQRPDVVDISEIDGVRVKGHQGPGTLTDSLIKTVQRLQGTMRPQKVIAAAHHRNIQVEYLPSYSIGYVSPFLNATTGRIDQGVDFTGTGPILAVGEAEILQTGAPGWPEGGGVLYRLLNGPRAGQVIYVFEGIKATVHAGQKVSAGAQIGLFVTGGSIEMGFANAAGVPLSHGEYTEGLETVWGTKMAAFLAGIGGPSALTPNLGQLSPGRSGRPIKAGGRSQKPVVGGGRSGGSPYGN